MQKVLYMLDLLFLINQKNKNYEKKINISRKTLCQSQHIIICALFSQKMQFYKLEKLLDNDIIFSKYNTCEFSISDKLN